MKESTRILIVEDRSADADLAKHTIRKVLKDCEFQVVETRADFLEALELFKPDVILSDYSLPRFDGMSALRLTLERAPLTPLIIWTGSISEDVAVECMKAGANNYILKDNVKRLGPALIHALEERQLLLERKQAEEKYQNIIENSVEGIFQSTPQGRYLNVNPAMARIYGYDSPQDMLSSVTSIASQIYVDAARRNEFMKALNLQGIVHNHEERNYRKDGSMIWTSTSARTVRDDQGKILYYEGFIQDITQRKEAEEALQHSEKRFRALIENGLDNISLLEADGTLIWESPAAIRMLAYEENEFLGRDIFSIMHPKDLEWTRQLYMKLLQEPGGHQRGTFRLRRSDGTWRWVDAMVTNMLDEASVGAIVVNYRDITESKQAEEALLESQARYQSLVETSHDLIWSVDADGKITFLNQAAEEIYGYEPEELIGRSFFEIMNPEHYHRDSETFVNNVSQTYELRDTESHVRHRDGREIILSANSIVMRDGQGNVIGVTGSSRDITERKQMEESLREERNLLRTLIDNIPDRIYAMDLQGRKTLSNVADWKASGGKTMEDVLGKTDFDTYPPELAGPFWQVDKDVLESGQPILNLEEPGLDAEGNSVSILTSKIPLRDQNGMVAGLVGVGRDITERKRVDLERQTLLEIMQGLANAIGLQELLERIHHSIKKVIYAENFFVVLYQQNSGLFQEIYSVDKYDAPAAPSALENSITSYVFRSGEPLLLTQERFDELEAQGQVSLIGTNSASWLGAPLKTSGRTIGVIAVQDYDNDNRYSERDKEFLTSIAAQIALVIERKQAEEALRESEEHYRTIFEGVQDAIFVESMEGKILMVNDRACEMFGYSRAEFLTKAVADIVPVGHLLLTATHESVALSSEPRETVNRRANGETFPVEISGRLQEINGETVLLVVVRDITERKQAEEALHRSEALYRQAIEVAGAVPYYETYYEEGRRIKYEFIGEGIRQITGYGPEEFDAFLWDSLVEEVILVEDLTGYSLEEGIQKVRNGENSIWKCEHRLRDRDGKEHWVFEAAVELRDEDGVAYGSIGTYQDITERKRAENELRESEMRYRGLFENLVIGFALHEIITDGQGQPVDYVFLEVNPAFEKLTGLDAHKAVGKRVTEILPGSENDRFIRIYGQVALTGRPAFFEEYSEQLGKYYQINAYSPRRGQFAVTFADITERKTAEIELQQRNDDLALLNTINEEVIRGQNLDSIVELLAKEMSRIFSSQGSTLYTTVYMLAPDKNSIRLQKYFFAADIQQKIEKLIGRAIPIIDIPVKEGGHFHQARVNGQGTITTGSKGIQQWIYEFTETKFLPSITRGMIRKLIPQIQKILNINSVICVPLISGGETIGFLDISGSGLFNVNDQKRIENIAGQLTAVIQRQRAEEAEHEQRALAEALRDTAETLSSTLDYGEVLDHILAAVGRVVPHDAATIMLIEKGSARVVRSYGYDKRSFNYEVMGVELSLAETTNLRQMLETGQPVVVSDTHTFPGWKRLKETDWLRSNVGSPIWIYGNIVGFILLDSQTPGFFTPVHAERLKAFANQAALAMYNANLLKQAQEEIVERKRVEASLQTEREKAQKYLDIAGVMMLALDSNGIVTLINQKGCEILGYLPDEIIGKNWIETFLPEDSRKELQDVFQQLISGDLQAVDYYENMVITKSGETRLIAWHNTSVTDGSGMIVSTLSSGEDITERKRAEAQLRASEERFRQLADNIQEAFWMTDAESGEEIYLSPAAEAIWERPVESFMSEPDAFIKTVYLEDQPAVLAAIEKEQNGESVEIEYRIVRPNGSLRWLWDRAFPIVDESGKVKRIAGITADVTERRESELALVQSQSRYRELFDNSPISLWEEDYSLVKQQIDLLLESGVTDLKNYLSSHPEVVLQLASQVRIVDANKAALELYGLEREDVLLKQLGQVVSQAALAHFEEEILGFLSASKRFTWEGTDKLRHGRQIEVIVNGSIPHGYEEDWSKAIVSVSDITERKQVEQQLRQLSRAVEQSASTIIITDTTGIIEYVNPKFAEVTGYTLEEVIGQNPKILKSGLTPPQQYQQLWQTITAGKEWHGELLNRKKNDELYWEHVTISPILNERGEITHFVGVKEDITQRKQNEVEIQRHLTELEALYENGLAVGHLLTTNEIGNRVINTFARYLEWHHVTIRLRKEESDELELVAFNLPNLREEQREQTEQHFNTLISRAGQGLSGWVIQTGLAVRTGNVHANPRYIDIHPGIQSGLYMPLKVGEQAIGVISVESELPEAFTEQDERLLATIANQTAIAFENARLYEAVQKELAERRRAQDALRASESHYRELADSITDILFELDQQLHLTHWNKASEELTGISAMDAIGKSIHEVFGTSEKQMGMGLLYEDILRNRQPKTFETTFSLDDQKRSFEINAYPSTRGVSVVAKDITDRKRNETIMQKRFELMEYSAHHSLEELMQKTMDEVSELTGSPIGFFHFVEEDQISLGIKTWSTNTLKLFHVDLNEGSHRSLDKAGLWAEAARQRRPLIHNDFEALSGRKELPQGHEKIRREMIIPIIRNERIMAIMGIANKPQDYARHDLEIASRLADYAWDITERKQMELALEAERNQLARRVDERTADLSRANSNLARALRVKDEFLANMSHELRTPLNAILGLSESLSEQIAGPLNEKQQKYISTISESGHHLLALINDILDLAKIEAGQITLDINKVDIHSVCQASLRMIKQLAQKKNQEVSLEIDAGLGLMWADERRLKQMIVNLLGNAVKFTPENGRLGLEVHGDEDANKISFTVWDKGIGIKQEDLTRLFQPFVQLDSGLAREATGTGLGLALVAQMARLHGGSITAISEPESGSRFSVILPWEPALAMDAATRMKITGKFHAIKVDEVNKPTILLVEDTREVTMMVKDYLELTGYKVVTAQDGVDAIVQAKLVKPDLILMDVQMPRMDGLEATRKLRGEPDFRYTPIIALTALAMPNDRERCLEAGMDEYISKPINLKALVKIIQGCLFSNQDTKHS